MSKSWTDRRWTQRCGWLNIFCNTHGQGLFLGLTERYFIKNTSAFDKLNTNKHTQEVAQRKQEAMSVKNK